MSFLLKRILPLCLLLCLAFLLPGCSPLAFQNVNDLLHAPELGRGQGEIQKALAAYLGEQPEYKYPKEGDWRSPLILEDLNGDGSQEGVLLYSLSGSATAGRGNNVYMAVLENQQGSWVVTQDMEGPGTEVASFETANLLDNGKTQLVIGFSTSSSLGNKTLSIYEYVDGKLAELAYPTPYSRYELADFSGNGGIELVIVSPDDQKESMKLQYIPAAGGILDTSLAPVMLDANFASCSGIYPTSSTEGERMLILDGKTDKGVLYSDLLRFSGEHFYKVDDGGVLTGETARANALLTSRDIDGDGVVEIPQRVGLTEIVTLAGDKKLEYVQWIDFTGAEPQNKQFGMVDTGKGAYIRLPTSWQNNIRVEDGQKDGEWYIQMESTRKKLLSLQIFNAGEAPPPNALLVSQVSGAYLVPSISLTSAERDIIAVTSLF